MDGLDNKKYVLEYSLKQNCFHVDDIERSAETNFNSICKHCFYPDYIPIGYGTEDELKIIKQRFCNITGVRNVIKTSEDNNV